MKRKVGNIFAFALIFIFVFSLVFVPGGKVKAVTPFTAGNIVVYRVGSGIGSLVNTGNPVFLDEYSPSGTLVQSIALPTTVSGSNKQLVAVGTSSSEGFLTRSTDGKYLMLAGYAATPPYASNLAATTGSTVNRVVGRVDTNGSIDTTTALSDFASTSNPRSVVSTDGTAIWITGGAGGVRYTTLGSTTSTQLSTTVTNLRGVNIANGQLYVSSGSSTYRVASVGSGLPTTSGQTITNLPGFPITGSPYGFFFADLSSSVAGDDTLFVADDTNGAGGAITKYSLVGGSWVSIGTVGATADAYRGLTGSVSGTTVTLFATRKGGTGTTGGGELVSLVDTGGYNAAFSSSTFTLLATAATNTAFRGVVLTPQVTAGLPNLTINDVSVSEGNSGITTFTFTVSLSAPAGAGGVTFDIATADNTASSPSDYTAKTLTSQTIPAGSSTATFDVLVNGDTIVEPDETFFVNVTNVTGANLTDGQGLGTILNDDVPPTPTNPSGSGSANPGSVAAGANTLLTVSVTPGTNPTSTGLAVTCDLTAIGGSNPQSFFDDGTHGDVLASNNIFSFNATVDGGTSIGAKSMPCTITDTNPEHSAGSASIALTVTAYIPPLGTIVVSQVYGGGGNSGATYKNDFIELFNRGLTTITLTGWSVQYGAYNGTGTWAVTNLTGSIAPGKYYLVQEAAGTGGLISLPTPDAIGSIAMSANHAKVALVSSATALSGACPASTSISDLVGYGNDANCSETTPTAALTNTTAAIRNGNGNTDTNNNAADFTVGDPNPHNSVFPWSASGMADPRAILLNQTTLLTVTVTPDISPASTSITVACDLSPIGGSASQAFFDDLTHGDLVKGDNTFSYSITATLLSTQDLTCTYADAQGRSGTAKISLSVLSIIPIGTVNGPIADGSDAAKNNAAKVGEYVAIQGVIYEKTLSAASWGGAYYAFFIQNTAATRDADPNTSDGLYVFMSATSSMDGPGGSTYTPAVGDEVVLTGLVTEYYYMTELTNPRLAEPVIQSGVNLDTALPPFVAAPPDNLADANIYWERLQGMRGQVPANSIVLNGRNVFSPADAEIWLARPDSTVVTHTGLYDGIHSYNDYTRRAFRDAHPLDDNYNATTWDGNGYRILMGSLGIKYAANDAQALLVPARTFDTVTNAPVGGVNYSFNKYRIEVITQPALSDGVDPAANNPPATFDRSVHYTIADYNLENLYDYRDNPFSGCDFPSNLGCPQVTPFLAAVTPPYDYVPASDAVYQARLKDIALQIINDLHSPDILMVQEVENQDICTVTSGAMDCGATNNKDGKPDVLQELALKVAANGGPAYDAAFDRDSSDLRGIAPAFLYRTDRVQLLPPGGDPILGAKPTIDGYTSVGLDGDVSNPKTFNALLPAGVSACETNWVFPRAPDVGLFRIYNTSIGVGNHADVYVINNHFKSGPDTCTGHRTEQAKYNAALVAYIQAHVMNARIVVGGDLNVYPRPDDIAYGASDQLGSLYDPSLGLKNMWEVLLAQAPEAAYSYVYLGMAQTLDQMFVNEAMLDSLEQFRIAHINSDFAADYPDDVARGTSDHDPNVATFILKAPGSVSINNIPAAHAAVYGGSFTPTFTKLGGGTASVASLTTSTCTVTAGVVSYVGTGTCTLQASVAESTYYLAATGAAQSFTIDKALATVTFGTGNPAALQVSTPGGSYVGSLTLTVYVTSPLGDINNALMPTITLSPLAGGSEIKLNCSTSTTSGTTKTFTCTYNGTYPVNTYDVIATVTGDYYTGVGYDGFTVYDPSLGFATGGGWYYWPGTTDKTIFGFVMKYNKGGTSPKGSLLVVRHFADGTIARIKSNSLSGLAIQTINSCGIATFSGKATYMAWDVTAGAYVTSGGITFSVYASDCNNPGTGIDSFWVRSTDKLTMPGTGSGGAVALGGGNIVVPHTVKK
jgi:uncharacterized protein